MDVPKVGGDYEPSFGRRKSVCFAFYRSLPKLLSCGGLENNHFVIQAGNELIPGDDEFDRSRVNDFPKKALAEVCA